jgi:sirohydrochlorin cobaltochelatase
LPLRLPILCKVKQYRSGSNKKGSTCQDEESPAPCKKTVSVARRSLCFSTFEQFCVLDQVFFGEPDKYCYSLNMNIPILIPAFGTTATALSTYSHLDDAIRSHFSENEIIWSYSSRVTTKKMPQPESAAHLSLEEALRQLQARQIGRAVVQSLHLLPGTEFHDLQRTVRNFGLASATGMPLLSTPDDYDAVEEILRPTITERPTKAILLLGHGTTHPTWSAYYCLEKILRRKFAERIFVGALEKFPDSRTLPAEIKGAGFTEVCIIPLLLIAGMHYHRDIVGDGQASWATRLRDNNLKVETISHGLGLFPGMERLIIRHITQALRSFDA